MTQFSYSLVNILSKFRTNGSGEGTLGKQEQDGIFGSCTSKQKDFAKETELQATGEKDNAVLPYFPT